MMARWAWPLVAATATAAACARSPTGSSTVIAVHPASLVTVTVRAPNPAKRRACAQGPDAKASVLGATDAGAAPTGAIPTESAERVLREGYGCCLLCLDEARARIPSLSYADVTVELVVAPDGRVTHVGTTPAASDAGLRSADPLLEACIAREFFELRFDPPDGGSAKVSYPLSFSRGP